ncbi:two component transcriptional regulator, winged helix family [Syntrophobotulus glycolicus DSM 8271]|uniref:Stage 0 sporulation protein A homolog n=1 Tax=Syntrophobotulus glycolicus (strain DSM 8271 / FlGlyR) TaxID=645991 RepID=F0SV47_SYNGF|nr:response regulator transcription factor [Syntrophobotulus glycolicus]ADY55547.1 two component transcriptional regulator, winged helix family [Syntrophobotulus glycolicus DSM 8271]
MNRILLLEDDLSLLDGLSYSLKRQGFGLDIARTIKEAGTIWLEGKYDLLILDLSLPDGSGFEICQKVRQVSNVPIIFLTASDEEINIVKGLDLGGDDYLTKPFRLGVLISRMNALLRRAKNFGETDTEISSNGIKVLLLQGQVYKAGRPLALTTAEYRLLCLLMQNPNRILSKAKILDKLWDGDGNYVDDNTLAVYIHRLRLKIENNPAHPQMLLTIRGMGYKWTVVS